MPTSSARKKIEELRFYCGLVGISPKPQTFFVITSKLLFYVTTFLFPTQFAFFVHIVFNCLLDVFIYQRYLSLDAIISRILFFHHYLVLLEEHRASTECICITQFPLNVLLRVSCGRSCLSVVGWFQLSACLKTSKLSFRNV